MVKTPNRPSDPNQFAKLIADNATGEAIEELPSTSKDPAAVALGRKGGLKGGAARAIKLNAQQRSEIAKKAAESRWAKNKKRLINVGSEPHCP